MTEIRVLSEQEMTTESLQRLRREHLRNSRLRRLLGSSDSERDSHIIPLFGEDLSIA